MSQIHRKSISSEQWDEAAASYELGYKHAARIAQEFGVSAATVSREFKRRGSRKWSRFEEVVAEVRAKLDAEAAVKARRQRNEAVARTAGMDALVGELMDLLMATNKAGTLASANAEIARIGKALELHTR